jgi:hypothetical protein
MNFFHPKISSVQLAKRISDTNNIDNMKIAPTTAFGFSGNTPNQEFRQ